MKIGSKKYRIPLLAAIMAFGIQAHAEKVDIPEFGNLVVVGDVTVFFTQGDYPGYIDVDGSADGITTVWGDSSLVLVMGNNPPKSIRITASELSSVTLTANTTFISEGEMKGEKLTLTGTDHCTFNVPNISAEKVAVSLSLESSANIRKVITEKLSFSVFSNSTAEISGIEAESVAAVSGDNSVMGLTGRCGKKNVVLINGGVVNTKGLIEDGATYVHKEAGVRKNDARNKKEIPVNIP